MVMLAGLFLLTAALYATVGFGGGSTYTALLVLGDVDYRLLPAISLVCNVIVVTGGTIRYARAGLVPWRRVVPIMLISAPMAWLGGLTPIGRTSFIGLLGLALLVAAILLLVQSDRPERAAAPSPSRWRESTIGGAVGYLSGLVGIGGGIFLAPLLHLMRWGQAREIAATASVFILVNSLAGLGGQLMKLGSDGQAAAIAPYWPLAVAVLVGGQIGSHVGLKLLAPSLLRQLTGLLVLYVAVRLLLQYRDIMVA
jgi:uncharacterized membrane protein YfcA